MLNCRKLSTLCALLLLCGFWRASYMRNCKKLAHVVRLFNPTSCCYASMAELHLWIIVTTLHWWKFQHICSEAKCGGLDRCQSYKKLHCRALHKSFEMHMACDRLHSSMQVELMRIDRSPIPNQAHTCAHGANLVAL